MKDGIIRKGKHRRRLGVWKEVGRIQDRCGHIIPSRYVSSVTPRSISRYGVDGSVSELEKADKVGVHSITSRLSDIQLGQMRNEQREGGI